MAVNLAKNNSSDKYPVTCQVQPARYPRHEYRAKNSESCIAEPGVAGMRPVWKGQAKPVDKLTDCLNLTFCHSGPRRCGKRASLMPGDQPDPRELPEAVFFLWRCLANNVN